MEEFHNRLYAVRANECPAGLFVELQTPKADKEPNKGERERKPRRNFNTEQLFVELSKRKSGNQPTSNPQMGKQKVSGKKGERPKGTQSGEGLWVIKQPQSKFTPNALKKVLQDY